MPAKLLLIDALSLIHRAYHAYPPLTDKSGRPIGALYGVSRIFLSVTSHLKPKYVLAAFDTKEPTFRHKAFRDYKAKRPKIDETMLIQIPLIMDLFRSAGCTVLVKDGFEADDLIGSFIEQSKKDSDHDFVILSGDYDLAQLIDDEKVILHYTRGSVKNADVINQSVFVDRWGFKPPLLADYKALAGDASDNIKGVKGIGAKTARILVSLFGSVETIYQILKEAPEVIEKATSPRVVRLLSEGQESALLSKRLAVIKRDVDLSLKPNSLKPFSYYSSGFLSKLAEYNFKSLIKIITDDGNSVLTEKKGSSKGTNTKTKPDAQMSLF